MTNPMKAVPKSAAPAVALEVALEGARRATGGATSSAALADPEVVAIARRRQISPSEKRRIVAAAERCTEAEVPLDWDAQRRLFEFIAPKG